MTSASLIPVATGGYLDGWGWGQLVVSALTLTVGASLLIWAQRAERTAQTWAVENTEGATR